MVHKFIFYLFLVTTMLSCKVDKTKNVKDYDYLPKNPNQQVVLDISQIFNTIERKNLISKIISYEKNSSNQIAILTVDSINPYKNIQVYGTEVANHWGVGRRDRGNGLMIVFCKPCRKVAICTGNGTEKVLTDSICSSIIENTMIPSFKNKAYYQGIDKALDSLIKKWN